MKSPAAISALNSMKRARSNRTSYLSYPKQPSNGAGTTSFTTTFLSNFRNRFEQARYTLRFAQARRSAYIIFARRYPDWVASGFDYRFLKDEAAPILNKLKTDLNQPLSEELAQAWVTRSGISESSAPEMIAKATEIADHFLYILRTELPFHLPANQLELLMMDDAQSHDNWEIYRP